MVRIAILVVTRSYSTLCLALAITPSAQSNFYEGKTIRIIVGFTAGGGYDAYTRTIARHMGKHIPGNPTIVVENMPGAGSMISANYTFKVAKPDGLTIGHFIGGLFLQQLLGKPGIEFDAAKFEYVGVPAQDNFIFGVHKSTGITDVERLARLQTSGQIRRCRQRLRHRRHPEYSQSDIGSADSIGLRLQRHRRCSPGV